MRARNGRRKSRERESRKRLAYGVIAVALILAFTLACFLAYSSLHSSPPKVAIVDHLSFFPEQRNPAFVDACKNILEEGGLTWAYYKGEEVTVNFYRKLPSYGTSLIILRVHSAIMKVNGEIIPLLGFFTSERYSDEAARKYRDDVLNDRLVKAFFPGMEEEYFGIVPKFVEESMKGEFKNTIIIMMGCEGLGYNDTRTGERMTYTDMAKAFIKRGAKVYIGWDGPIGIDRTDQATIHLLQSLILENRTIEQAVGEIDADHDYESVLRFYPNDAGNYAIPNLRSSLTMNVAYTPPAPEALKRTKYLSGFSTLTFYRYS